MIQILELNESRGSIEFVSERTVECGSERMKTNTERWNSFMFEILALNDRTLRAINFGITPTSVVSKSDTNS